MALSLVTVVTFMAAALAAVGVYSVIADVYLRDRLRINQRVEEEFALATNPRLKKSVLFKDLGKIASETATRESRLVALRSSLEEMVEQSGLNITLPRLLIMSSVLGVALGAAAGYLSQNVIATTTVTAAGLVGPVAFVQLKRKRRLDKMLSQLPDALDLMARSVRAGQTMSQALQAISDEFQDPIATEFAYCYEQQNLGLSAELAYEDLGRRSGLLEIKIFVLAMMVQRQTGGNLAELLEKLAGVVRDRFRIKGRIKVLTAEGRIQAVVLLAMPPVVFLMMLFINPDYTKVLLEHRNAIAFLAVMMGMGALWIRRIVNFDF